MREPEWPQEIWKKDMLVFPGTVRANLDRWKVNMIVEVFNISRKGLGFPQKCWIQPCPEVFCQQSPFKRRMEIFGVQG
jgi:hypothetical protein